MAKLKKKEKKIKILLLFLKKKYDDNLEKNGLL